MYGVNRTETRGEKGPGTALLFIIIHVLLGGALPTKATGRGRNLEKENGSDPWFPAAEQGSWFQRSSHEMRAG